MVEVKMCVGSACYVAGSHDVIHRIQNLIKEHNLSEKVDLKAAFCLGHCNEAVCIVVDDVLYSVNNNNVDQFFDEHIKNYIIDKVE